MSLFLPGPGPLLQPHEQGINITARRAPQTYPGRRRERCRLGPAGDAQQIYLAGLASEDDSAASGKVLQRYTAAPANENDQANAAAAIIQPKLVLGGLGNENDSAPSGQARQIYTAAPANENDWAPRARCCSATPRPRERKRRGARRG